MTEPVTWRQVIPNLNWDDPAQRDGRDPDALAETSGHVLYAYDEEKARSMIARCQAFGGNHFRASPDLVWMLLEGHYEHYPSRYGFHLAADDALPENTVVPE